jgi:dihydropteroate synthase
VRAQIMGIVNVTPESAWGGHSSDAPDAIALGRRVVAEGADLLDVSGVPKSGGVAAELEVERLLPVVEALAREAPICVSTTRQSVAEAVVAAGATVISDQSGVLYATAAGFGVGWIVVHRPGPSAADLTPREAIDQSLSYLTDKAGLALRAGVPDVWIDPGMGFDRPPEQSLALLANIGEFVATGYPVLVSASRKRFLPKFDETSLAAATWGLDSGCAMVRVHDVAATTQALSVVSGQATEALTV